MEDFCLLSYDQATSVVSGWFFGLLVGVGSGFFTGRYLQFFERSPAFSSDSSSSETSEVSEEEEAPETPERPATESSSSESGRSFADVAQELQELLEEQEERMARDEDEVLQRGRDIGSQPVGFFVKSGGGYATNGYLEDSKKQNDMFKRLTPEEEDDILKIFRPKIEGVPYRRAMGIVEEQGYTLHPIYVNDLPKRSSLLYKGTVIGVRLKDPEFDILTNRISSNATVDMVIDIGGEDKKNIGATI